MDMISLMTSMTSALGDLTNILKEKCQCCVSKMMQNTYGRQRVVTTSKTTEWLKTEDWEARIG
jgi:hypothetical protein